MRKHRRARRRPSRAAPLPPSMETVSAMIAARCAQDPAWKARFTANPRAVLQAATGEAIYPGMQIHVHRNDAANWHVALPEPWGALSDESLRDCAAAGASADMLSRSVYDALQRAAISPPEERPPKAGLQILAAGRRRIAYG